MAAALGSVVQTQFNLAALIALGVDVPLVIRLRTTLADLLGFTPLYGAVVAMAFLLAFPVAALLVRLWPARDTELYMLAGALAILAGLTLMNTALAITAIAATRSTLALLLMMLAGAAGGWLFARTGRADATGG
ncbi:MAG: hypothetical protein JJT85_01540 [Chromatiales bacterium]|nr:hypothetical protein [Chromatiales bacterium]